MFIWVAFSTLLKSFFCQNNRFSYTLYIFTVIEIQVFAPLLPLF